MLVTTDLLRKWNVKREWALAIPPRLSSREAEALLGEVSGCIWWCPRSLRILPAGWHRMAAWASGRAGGMELSSLAWTCLDCGDEGRGSPWLPGGADSATVVKGQGRCFPCWVQGQISRTGFIGQFCKQQGAGQLFLMLRILLPSPVLLLVPLTTSEGGFCETIAVLRLWCL